MVSRQAVHQLGKQKLGCFKRRNRRLTWRWIATAPSCFPLSHQFKLLSSPRGGGKHPQTQKQFTCWTYQSTVCKDNTSTDYRDTLTRFLWKETYCSRCGQKRQLMVTGESWVFRDWKTGIVLILYKARQPIQYEESQRSFSLVIQQPSEVLIKRFTQLYMLHSKMGPISKTGNL